MLEVIRGSERGCRYEVLGFPITMGAAPGNDLLIVESSISRSHAVLEGGRGYVEVVDQNSENGTFVNGEPVRRHRLSHGDRLQLATEVEFRFRDRGRT